MSDFDEIERDEMEVQFVRAEGGLAGIRQAWDGLGAVISLSDRHFYGVFYPREEEYLACVELQEGEERVFGLESVIVPGGHFLRARLEGEPPGLYERIGPTFYEMISERVFDKSRPSLEYYRQRGEIELFLPI